MRKAPTCLTDSKYTSESFGQYRRNHQRCSVKKGILGNFAKFTGKHLYQSLLFNKVGGLRPATLLKKTLWHRCFPVNFAKFQRTPFLQKSSGRLLLSVIFAISLAQKFSLTLEAPISQNGQTHLNNSSANCRRIV